MKTLTVNAALLLMTVAGTSLAGNPPRLGFSSIGKIRVGMTEEMLVKALGSPLIHSDPDAESDGCYYASAKGLPGDIGLMIMDGQLSRIDVTGRGISTHLGATIGMSEEELKKLYGPGLIEQSDAYTGPQGHYLTLRSPDGKHALRFETDGKTVTDFYAGTMQAIQYIEGCL